MPGHCRQQAVWRVFCVRVSFVLKKKKLRSCDGPASWWFCRFESFDYGIYGSTSAWSGLRYNFLIYSILCYIWNSESVWLWVQESVESCESRLWSNAGLIEPDDWGKIFLSIQFYAITSECVIWNLNVQESVESCQSEIPIPESFPDYRPDYYGPDNPNKVLFSYVFINVPLSFWIYRNRSKPRRAAPASAGGC